MNQAPLARTGEYVLYWMQAYRRLDHNHALDHALLWAEELEKPLVVYEGLRLDYPWASQRLHRFILEGMRSNSARAAKLGINYWPFVETPHAPARGLLPRLASRAALVVTDDFPAFIFPGQTAALARKTEVPVTAVDGNGVIPLSLLGEPAVTAAQLRRRIHANFAECWPHRTRRRHSFPDAVCKHVDPPFQLWDADSLDEILETLPLDGTVPPVPGMPGGTEAARRRLQKFVKERLPGYAERRSQPAAPGETHASGLSPYLHFGHISVDEVVETALGEDWSPDQISPKARGKRQGFYCSDADVNSFLDEAITWRDVGMNWHRGRNADTAHLKKALPAWALATLHKHADDRRTHLYSLKEWEAGQTHDPLWNAAQRELVATGTIHNYLRMIWGKKVLEWSKTPEEAYQTLVHLNNKYALDGRDPNSYTNILWCFGLFDRAWGPERQVFGKVRYMSSENTARKFPLGDYMEYVESLPTIAEVRGKDSTT